MILTQGSNPPKKFNYSIWLIEPSGEHLQIPHPWPSSNQIPTVEKFPFYCVHVKICSP